MVVHRNAWSRASRRQSATVRPSWRTILIPILCLTAYGLWGLTLPRGDLRVVSEIQGASVQVDDWFSGRTPFHVRLPAGTHKVLIRADGYEPKQLLVTLSDSSTTLDATLDAPLPPSNDAQH